METSSVEITTAVVERINKFLKTRLTQVMIPKCFGDPLLESGLCNPKYPLPSPTDEIPVPSLCGLHHICCIQLAEQVGVPEAKEEDYERLTSICMKRLGGGEEAKPDQKKDSPEKEKVSVPKAPKDEKTDNVKPKEEAKTATDVESSIKSPFRTNSIPSRVWDWLCEVPYTEESLGAKMKEEGVGYAKYYIPQVIQKARDAGVLKEEDGQFQIVS